MPVALGVNGGIFPVDNMPSPTSASGVWTMNEAERHIRAGRWPTLGGGSSLPEPGEYLDVANAISSSSAGWMDADPTSGNVIAGTRGSGTEDGYLSTDGGLTWAQVPAGAPAGSAFAVGNGKVIRLYGTDVYVSSDNGATWGGPYTAPSDPDGWLHVDWITGDNWLLWNETNTNVATSADNGQTWTYRPGALAAIAVEFSCDHTTGTVVMATNTTASNRSTDNGASWTGLTYGGTVGSWWIPQAGASGEWFGADVDTDAIAVSSDDGVTWTPKTLPFSSGASYAYKVSYWDGAWYVFVSGNMASDPADEGVWKTTDLGDTWTHLAYDGGTRGYAFMQTINNGILIVRYRPSGWSSGDPLSVMLYGIP